eukprot:TRINITY_DN779840_c0_g1_i1.p1 TRINITY_DN779840_c0_g1~~TRINITY_DN779840_c0_g1_i1.p1  ORF type:complete len:189 (+),score=33.95 TRINITY_DN779840_c0_g1_i1:120-686(+)
MSSSDWLRDQKGVGEVSLSSFAFLFSEIVRYSQSRVNNTSDLKRRLESLGHDIGTRILELITVRERIARGGDVKRETKLLNMLKFISNRVWKLLFGKPASSLQKSTEKSNEYMINDNSPLTNTFISVPKDFGNLNCAAFIAGIVNGILDAAGFACNVTAHTVANGDGSNKTTFLIEFSPETMKRESKL